MPQHLRGRALKWASHERCWSKSTPRFLASVVRVREVPRKLTVKDGSERKFCLVPRVRSSKLRDVSR